MTTRQGCFAFKPVATLKKQLQAIAACQFEAEGGLTGDTLVVDPGQTGWLVKARRVGALLELSLEKPASTTAALPSFCAEGGRIGGLLFPQCARQ